MSDTTITVGELIKELQQLDPALDVVLSDDAELSGFHDCPGADYGYIDDTGRILTEEDYLEIAEAERPNVKKVVLL